MIWRGIGLCVFLLLTGCAGSLKIPAELEDSPASLTPTTRSHENLIGLPRPKGKIVAAVYSFRDQSGQYKPAPDSSFSTSVTQGASSLLVKALLDSQWFIPVERENLQNLLTERRIVRAGDAKDVNSLPQLMSASVLLEGGIVAYESNVRTGGDGAKYLGVGATTQYRVDQVTVNLRTVDIRTGRILNSVSTTKTIFSFQLDMNVFRYVKVDSILELESGFARNEPAQLCVMDAIESAVTYLVVQGVRDKVWGLDNPDEVNAPLFRQFLEQSKILTSPPARAKAEMGQLSLRADRNLKCDAC
ncbi:MAG: curli production assembly/transport protein CsgG [Sulfuricella sp.]|nr:curli production assembly/transport protein CsgG [Sulfuricella sp.]